MLQNAYFLAKIGADTAENEQHFAENLPTGRRGPEGGEARAVRRPSRAAKLSAARSDSMPVTALSLLEGHLPKSCSCRVIVAE